MCNNVANASWASQICVPCRSNKVSGAFVDLFVHQPRSPEKKAAIGRRMTRSRAEKCSRAKGQGVYYSFSKNGSNIFRLKRFKTSSEKKSCHPIPSPCGSKASNPKAFGQDLGVNGGLPHLSFFLKRLRLLEPTWGTPSVDGSKARFRLMSRF